MEDMLWVQAHAAKEDQTEGQKDARKWKREDFRAFMTKLASLEEAEYKAREAESRAVAGGSGAEDLAGDKGQEAALETAEEWLRNWRPDAGH